VKTLRQSSDRQEILTRIGTLLPTDQARWGKMSVHQMICHVSDSYLCGLGDKRASSKSGPLQRTLVKWMALMVPLSWPKGIPTRPEMEQGKGGTSPVDFNRDRELLVNSLTKFCDHLPQLSVEHPIFGSMTQADWWRWGYLHADHHLRQFGR
jgi:Protein of unknown function (DUF1569)